MELLNRFRRLNSLEGSVLDVGAGVGRVTRDLLSKYFQTIDLLDPSPRLLAQAEENLAHLNSQVRNFYTLEAKDFTFEGLQYDCVWIQWVSGYIPDFELKGFLIGAKDSLKDRNSFIVLKDNLSNFEQYFVSSNDFNTVRTEWQYLSLIHESGLEVIFRQISPLSDDLFPVVAYVLQPGPNSP
eukprot:TRINITY_DN13294_c0_g1_i6.p1 TRINITY_DN13294_c0_g1~~TRINITY_DN13294_c0_g1_i6.p1  ORF type:complete len:183 (+),score=42.70 TRINITY_DN13294_c0_g1_i6:422-970(+)